MNGKNVLFLIIFLIFSLQQAPAQTKPGEFYPNGNRDKKYIALTFDDGPGKGTAEVLDILKKYKIKARFFVEGGLIKSHPELIKRIVAEGHDLASHTYSHINFYKYKNADKQEKLTTEIINTEKAVNSAVKIKMKYLRMPYGYVRPWVKEVAAKTGYVLINWSFGCDWFKMTPAQLIEKYTKNISPGGILLFHDGGGYYKTLVASLPEIIETIRSKGCEIVPISVMIN